VRLQTEFDGEVAYVTFTNPPVNVIDFELIDELTTFLHQLAGEERLCAAVFRAEGRVFSAGVDIPAHLPATVEQMIRSFHAVFELLDELCVPTLAVVRGACLGGACELVAYLDAVIATESATFGVPEIKLGVFPPVAVALFPRRFGHQNAMRLLLTGEVIDAYAARDLGLATRVVSETQLASALEAELALLRGKSASSLRTVKRAVLAARGWTFRQLVAPSEQVYLNQLMATRDSVEGLNAFMEKRAPIWAHK
jgi:cyclohexa-1,5-dienecarbonyl-CoA hydratase